MPLTIGHLNARSLVPSVKEVNAILHAYSIDVFCIGETWLSRNTTPEQLQFPGYQLITNDRCGRIRGGVCILFRNDVTKVNTLKTTLPSSALETLWVTISAPFITATETTRLKKSVEHDDASFGKRNSKKEMKGVLTA